jgi:hypothetical protein
MACVIAGGGGIFVACGAESACDPALKAPDRHPFGYRSRGDRCEGVYIQPVAGTTMVVASFTQLFRDYDLQSGAPLILSWNPLSDGAVHLRGQSTRRRLYYRMDSTPAAGTSTYTWPTNVLASLALSRRDLGVTAWTRRTLNGVPRIVYLPLRISQGNESKESSSYELELLPNRELAEVFVTVRRLNETGDDPVLIKDAAKLGYGYYPAERVFVVPIPPLSTSGIYHLELGAVLSGGGSSTVELWFYHTGV